MEANKEKSDDPADHYGGINNMDAVNRNIHLLLNSIQKSDVYRTYKKQEAILEKNPELASRVQHFRSDNFRLQNEERGNCFRMRNSWHENQQNFEEIRR